LEGFGGVEVDGVDGSPFMLDLHVEFIVDHVGIHYSYNITPGLLLN